MFRFYIQLKVKVKADDYAKLSLEQPYQNAITFPWIKERRLTGKLTIHLWFFDIQIGQIYIYASNTKTYQALLAE